MRLLCTRWRHDGRSLLSRPADSVGRSQHSVWIQSRAKCSYRAPSHTFFLLPLCVPYFSSNLFSFFSIYIAPFLSLSFHLPLLCYSLPFPLFWLFSFTTSSLFSLSLSHASVSFLCLSVLILRQFVTYHLSADHPCWSLQMFTETSLRYVF